MPNFPWACSLQGSSLISILRSRSGSVSSGPRWESQALNPGRSLIDCGIQSRNNACRKKVRPQKAHKDIALERGKKRGTGVHCYKKKKILNVQPLSSHRIAVMIIKAREGERSRKNSRILHGRTEAPRTPLPPFDTMPRHGGTTGGEGGVEHSAL